jgi:flavin reductase (DIM6/NTAB) family NADH-FMN oxidoreductase RutF
MSKKEIKRGCYLYPMPVVLVGSNNGGKANFMPAAFCGMVNIKPPVISVGLDKHHFTTLGIDENGTFSVSIPSRAMMKVTDYCGLVSGKNVDKSKVFKVFYGKLETAPLIEDCPITMECKVRQFLDFEIERTFIGEIIATYCDDEHMGEKGPDMAKVNPLMFSAEDNSYWSMGERIGDCWKVGKGYK